MPWICPLNLCSENKHFQTAIKHSVVAGCFTVSSQPQPFALEFLELAKLQPCVMPPSAPAHISECPHSALDWRGISTYSGKLQRVPLGFHIGTTLADDARPAHAGSLSFTAGHAGKKRKEKQFNVRKLKNKDINYSGYDFPTFKKKNKKTQQPVAGWFTK